ncbi:MAG: hypothetical protein OXE76_03965 [Alphaproteobacteria bacterium]|nr:hypothetical protein [Alphaproteobacteria bacterium]
MGEHVSDVTRARTCYSDVPWSLWEAQDRQCPLCREPLDLVAFPEGITVEAGRVVHRVCVQEQQARIEGKPDDALTDAEVAHVRQPSLFGRGSGGKDAPRIRCDRCGARVLVRHAVRHGIGYWCRQCAAR